MSGVVGKVELHVGEISSTGMTNTEIGARHHGEIVRIRRMKEGMKIGEAGAVLGQCGQVLVLDRDLVVDIFEHNDEHPVKVASARFGSGLGGCFFFSLRRLTALGQGWLLLAPLTGRW